MEWLIKVVIVAIHAWVLYELYVGRVWFGVRSSRDPDGWLPRSDWHVFDLKESPGFFWMAWGFKAGMLAIFWARGLFDV